MILEQHGAVAGMDLIMKTSEMFPKKGFNGPSFEDVNTAALNAYPSLLQNWFPAGRVQGHEFVVGNVNGDKGRSLSINTTTGVWSDFGDSNHGGSDPVSLYAARYQIGQGEACKRLAGDLGLNTNYAMQPPAPKAQARTEWKPILPAPCPPPHHSHHSRLGKPSQVWHYKNCDGQLLFLVCRFDKDDGSKDILPFSYGVLDGKEDWHWKAIADQRPLYGLDRLQASPQAKVLLVEGEKTADAAQRLLPSLVAITWPGGGKAAGKADWSPLNGREVVVWPDADKPGRETAEGWHTPHGEFKHGLVHYLSDAGAAVRVVEPPLNVKDGWDLADAEAERWDTERVVKWIRENMRQAAQPSRPEAVDAAGTAEETYFETIQRLAVLSTHEYEKCRKAEAKRLDMRTSVLDKEVSSARPKDKEGNDLGLTEPEPWPEPVNGDALLNGIVQVVHRYLVLPPNGAEAVALWVIAAHAFNGFQISPRLHVRSPLPRCGKTLLLDVVECLTPRSIRTENITTAVLFRLVDAYQPTLLIDEVDSFLKDNEELRGALNAGHRRGGQMLRCEGDQNEVRAFKTFAPVALAGIGRLPGTLEDRSITIEMRRKKPTEKVTCFRRDRTSDLDELASMAARWVADHEVSLSAADPNIPETLHDRAADNWRPLLTIADLARGDWPTLARQIAVRFSGGEAEQDGSVRVQLLIDIKAIFDGSERDQLPSAFICEQLAGMEASPWPEWRHGKPITVRQLARQLAPFCIAPGSIRTDAGTAKGYKKEAFKDDWSRYLPISSDTTAQVNATAALSPISIRHKGGDVPDEKTPKPAPSLGCDGVPDEKGGMGDERLFAGVEDAPETPAPATGKWQERI